MTLRNADDSILGTRFGVLVACYSQVSFSDSENTNGGFFDSEFEKKVKWLLYLNLAHFGK